MRVLRGIFALTAALACAAPVSAGAGARAFPFLLLDAGARPAALGGAYTALAGDVNALRYNPAGLARLAYHEAMFADNRHFQGVSHQHAAFVHKDGWGAGIDYVGYGGIQRTTIAQPDGTLGDFSARDLALSGGYGRTFFEDMQAGAALKYIRETIDDVSASAYALDAGVLYDVPRFKGLTLGAALQNIGPEARFEEGKKELPAQLRAGSAYVLRAARLEHVLVLDVTKRGSKAPDVHLGVETALARRMFVRLGFNTRIDTVAGVRVGFGWVVDRFRLDYAFVPGGELGGSHRLSFGIRWGDVRPGERQASAPAAPAPQPPPTGEASAKETGKTSPRVERADSLIELKKYDAAERELRTALGRGEREKMLLHERLGRIEFLRGRYVQARRHYRESIQLGMGLGVRDTAVAEAYAGIGRCLLRTGDKKEAGKFFRKALEIGPSLETAVYIRKYLAGP